MVTHKPDPPKHTGRFEMTMSGFPMWSCCQATEEEDRGCEDDQSIGVREYVNMKCRVYVVCLERGTSVLLVL